MTATILAQTADRDAVSIAYDDLQGALEDAGLNLTVLTRTAGPYDLIAQVDGTDTQIAAGVLAAQTSNAISRTLTLPWVPT